jgi:hypothetical protein
VTVRREAGEESVVQVHYSEGVANRAGPELCVVGCEAGGEASAGERIVKWTRVAGPFDLIC